MSTDLAVREPNALTLSNDQLSYIATTEFVPPGLRGNLPAILACVATGRALGIADMTALRSIHIIDGKATFSAELMVMLARQRGHSIQGTVTEGAATVTGKRADNNDTMTVEWTLAMAERAGLLGKQNWRKYPEAMLWARAVSQLCRELFADCFAGATYVPEELEAAGSSASVEDDGPDLRGGAPEGNDGAAEADTLAVDMTAPDIPFGDAPIPAPEPITGPQKKKLNVLIGKLRPAVVSTEDLWRMCDRPPKASEDGEVHWSPLRDVLTKGQAHRLIEELTALELAAIEERLLEHARSKDAAALADMDARIATARPLTALELAAIQEELLEHAQSKDAAALADMDARIATARQTKSVDEFAPWLRAQAERLDAKMVEGASSGQEPA